MTRVKTHGNHVGTVTVRVIAKPTTMALQTIRATLCREAQLCRGGAFAGTAFASAAITVVA